MARKAKADVVMPEEEDLDLIAEATAILIESRDMEIAMAREKAVSALSPATEGEREMLRMRFMGAVNAYLTSCAPAAVAHATRVVMGEG